MPASTLAPHLITLLSSQQISLDQVTDAIEEWINYRRAKGDTLFEVSVGLVELEDRTPPNLAYAFDRARYVTNVPQPSSLTPPTGPFPLSRSSSPATILNHLLSQPPPSLEHSREVILEYVLAREGKLREKKSGRCGKGTLGREGFEDIGRRLTEVEEGLKNDAPTSPKQYSQPMSASSSRDAYPTPRSPDSPTLNENQQIGLTLILSLRLSLSYFSLQELANQLLLLALGDAERTLVQHIRRRVQGEGRWGVGKELDYVEGLTVTRRPALRPAFRSAKARTQLPPTPTYPIQLPAPSKSACIKLIAALAKEYEHGGPSTAAAYIHSHVPTGVVSPATPGFSPAPDRSYFLSKRGATASPGTPAAYGNGSPQTPFTPLPPLSPSKPSQRPLDPSILANYTMELVSEFLTREKREHMLKNKWAKSGRDQLSKELGEIEASLCLASKNKATDLAQTLLPIFLLLRRTFALPRSPLPPSITEPYIDILPAPPDPDDVPFREPTVSTTTAALYVNPRLNDSRAEDVLQELIDSERENVENAGGSHEEAANWLRGLIDSVQKREVAKPPPGEAPPLPSGVSFAKAPSVHRRTKSSAVAAGSEAGSPMSLSLPIVGGRQHSRSLSMPQRRGTYDDSDSDSDAEERLASARPVIQQISTQNLAPSTLLSPTDVDDRRSSAGASGGGWWDVVSAVENDHPAPWHENPRSAIRDSTSSGAGSLGAGSLKQDLPLPPGAEPATIGVALGYPEVSQLQLSPPTPPRGPSQRSTPASTPGDRSWTIDLGSPPKQLHPGFGYSPSDRNLAPNHRQPQLQSQSPEQRLPPPPLRFEKPATSPAQIMGRTVSFGASETPSALTPPPSKSKLGGFGRSMSLVRSKGKDKENEKSSVSGKKEKSKDKDKVQNDPGRWNRDMVASIMGAPADRR